MSPLNAIGIEHPMRTQSSHIERARQRLYSQARTRAEQFETLRRQAIVDTQAIIHLITKEYRPTRIYQWGSVLRPGGFRLYSDIDIAVEGITDAQTFFRILETSQKMTQFPLDLVQIEKIAPEYAEDIRRNGKVLYEHC
jgi:predicted nucleotidyltransferase